MYKVILISSFLLVVLISCQKDTTVGSFNYEKDTPVWLKAKIDSISTDHTYYGAGIYRYEWDEKFIYHVLIPISSCLFCELYSQNGNKVQLSAEEFTDFIENKTNEVFIWEWDHE